MRRQTDFLDNGLDFLKPLSLKDVAETVGMHESTVSRVTAGLLMNTPRGTFTLKSFLVLAFKVTQMSRNLCCCCKTYDFKNDIR